MTDPIPQFPIVYGNVYPDGSAHINFAGHDVQLTPENGGDIVRITGTALVGRRPVNITGADLEVHRVEDPTRNLSRTHFVIAWSGDVPAVVDQHSGNGTVIVRGDVELVATPGVALPLQDGDHLRFGDLRAAVALSNERPEAPK